MGTFTEYTNPPLIQVALTIKFAPALSSLTMVDVATLYSLFKERFPHFVQIGRAGAMGTDPRDFIPDEIGSGLPRAHFFNPSEPYAMYFQDDRITVLWNRQTPLEIDPSYPGYKGVLNQMGDAVGLLRSWLDRQSFPPVVPIVCEIAYNNAFLAEVDGERRKLSDVFTVWKPERFPVMTGFNLGWVELLREAELERSPDQRSTGIVTVGAGAGMTPDNKPVVLLNLIGTSTIPDNGWVLLPQPFNEIHEKLTEVFESLVEKSVLMVKDV